MTKDEKGIPGFPLVTSWTSEKRRLLRLERDEEKASILDTIEQLPATGGRMYFLEFQSCSHALYLGVKLLFHDSLMVNPLWTLLLRTRSFYCDALDGMNTRSEISSLYMSRPP